MLPIVPIHNTKKKKTNHRPRFPPAKRRCVPQSSTLSLGAAAAETSSDGNGNVDVNGGDIHSETPHYDNGAILEQAVDGHANDAQRESTEASQGAHDDERALLLAAEAAAALLDDPTACLEDVGESIDAATAILTAGGSNVVDAFHAVFHDSPELQNTPDDSHPIPTGLTVPTLPPFEDSGPLGPLSDVKTFTSLPPDVGMSCAHSNFLTYYYGNEAVGVQHALPFAKEAVTTEEQQKENANGYGAEDEQTNKAKLLEGATLKSFCSKYPKQKKEKQTDQDSQGQEMTGSFENNNSDSAKQESVNFISAASASVPLPDATTNTDAPQVEIIDGEIVVRQSSLIPDPHHRTPTNLIDEEFGTAIIEDESSSSLGIIQAKYDSYMTNPLTRPSRWSVEETKAFYRALRQCGTDLSMMQMFLPNRTRGQLKNKLKSESRKHPKLVDMALDPKSRVKLDLSVFGELVIPDEVPQICAGAGQPTIQTVTPSESPPLEGAKHEDADEQRNDLPAQAKGSVSMEQYFDHLFDDAVDDTNEKDEENAIDPNKSSGSMNCNIATPPDLTEVAPEPTEEVEKQPAILPLAPVARNAKIKKTRFKAKPMAKKVGIGKK